ncbi:MAG: hypothetical protein HY981_03085 [Candidatus Magasanikbacteria bacterium]|nr:hypothetical protein [Candidatus Magasanikbacteria bacterium]
MQKNTVLYNHNSAAVDGQNNNAEVSLVGQGFSVNGVYGKPASSGKDAIPAYLVQESQHLAALSFYGFADKNHMPLRRIAIDWGDGGDIVGSGETSPVNYYKNKRGKLLQADGTVSNENGCNI